MDGSNTIPPRTPPTLNGTFHIVPIADNGDGVRRGKGMLYEVISTFADPLGKEELQKEDPTVSGGRVPRTSRMRPEPESDLPYLSQSPQMESGSIIRRPGMPPRYRR